MAKDAFNNKIDFPRLTNNTSGMFTTLNQPAKNTSAQLSSPSAQPKAPANLPPLSKPQAKSDKNSRSNYLLGLTAIAASVIAGIYIYKGRKPEAVTDAVEELPKINEPHLKDNFLKALGVYTVEPQHGMRKEYSFVKELKKKDADGNPIIKRHGIKRVEDFSELVNIHRTSFETDDGFRIAEAFRNGKGEVVRYTVRDREGRVLRWYDSIDGITYKNVYNKNGALVREVQFDQKGWTLERRYDSKGIKLEEEIQFGVNPDILGE